MVKLNQLQQDVADLKADLYSLKKIFLQMNYEEEKYKNDQELKNIEEKM